MPSPPPPQSVMMPLNAWEMPLFKKYVLGQAQGPEGAPLFGEQFTAPTEEGLALAARVAAAKLAAADPSSAPEELTATAEEEKEEKEEAKEKEGEKKKKKATGAAAATPKDDID
jgi:hypothetical protein